MVKIKELGHVVFFVRNLKRSADFYRDILGFNEIARENGMAMFSSGRTHHELLLIEIGESFFVESNKIKPGLYHVGFKIGDSKNELKEVYKRLKENGIDIIGTADHFVTHSIYIYDPDKNEIELYVNISSEWKKDPKIIIKETKPLNYLN